MKKAFINGSKYSPSIIEDRESGKFEISGKAMMNAPELFFELCLDRIKECLNYKKEIEIEIKLSAINTKNSKWIFYFLKQLEKLAEKENLITIKWKTKIKSDLIEETAEDFKELIKLPFKIERSQRA